MYHSKNLCTVAIYNALFHILLGLGCCLMPKMLNERQHVLALSHYQTKNKSVIPAMSKQPWHHSGKTV